MNNLSHLPVKFCFKLDEIGKRWIRETFGTDYYDESDGYFHYPDYTDFKGLKKGHHVGQLPYTLYTLITTDQLFPQPQIPTIEKGVMMLVWGSNESDAVEREVLFFNGEYYVCKNISGISYLFFRHAKPIPQIPEYTIEEAEKQFNIKIKCTSTE